MEIKYDDDTSNTKFTTFVNNVPSVTTKEYGDTCCFKPGR